MSWRELYTDARIRSGIAPTVKDDYYKIMSDAVRTINADTKVKEALLEFLTDARTSYKASTSYKWAATIPPMFVQWLSEKKNKKIMLSDLEMPNITKADAISFSEQYSKSIHTQPMVQSYLIKFGKFLVSGRYPTISKYPFRDLEIDMPEAIRIIVYNEEMLDDFYNVLLAGAPGYMTLFFRLLMETGQRPGHVYYLTCGDIEYDKPQKDALDRTFYPIFMRKILEREKRKIKETVSKKKAPANVMYISEQLKNDIVKWCDENKLTGKGYIFKDFVTLDSFMMFVWRRRTNRDIASRLKHKDIKYILYGTRHTWTSVMYGITRDIGDLIDLGGWTGANIPLTVYRVSMKSCEALAIAKKWEIYLPPDKRDEVLDLQGRCERKEEERVPGAPTVSTEELENVMAIIVKLQKRIEELEK